MSVQRNWLDVRQYLSREPVMLALLSIAALMFFLAVTGLSRVYHAQREYLGNRWFSRGVADLKAHQYNSAITEFRAALLYSRDDDDYQLNLAEALLGVKRTNEASAYLLNLWDREPENGLVNLELARIAAQQGQIEQALRYYHDAIYATWPGDQRVQRRDARVELIEYLLKINATTQAQSELIALEANLEDDSAQQLRVGDLFLQARDYQNALSAYRQSLKADRRSQAAMAGAGQAAFDLGLYPEAQRYLQEAVASAPGDPQSVDRLKTTELVLSMDPFRREISAEERDRNVIAAFDAAGERLKSCAAPTAQPSAWQADLSGRWSKMKPQMTEQGLHRNPDLMERSMDLVFSIERQTSSTCGAPTGTDLALLLIAKLHEGN